MPRSFVSVLLAVSLSHSHSLEVVPLCEVPYVVVWEEVEWRCFLRVVDDALFFPLDLLHHGRFRVEFHLSFRAPHGALEAAVSPVLFEPCSVSAHAHDPHSIFSPSLAPLPRRAGFGPRSASRCGACTCAPTLLGRPRAPPRSLLALCRVREVGARSGAPRTVSRLPLSASRILPRFCAMGASIASVGGT